MATTIRVNTKSAEGAKAALLSYYSLQLSLNSGVPERVVLVLASAFSQPFFCFEGQHPPRQQGVDDITPAPGAMVCSRRLGTKLWMARFGTIVLRLFWQPRNTNDGGRSSLLNAPGSLFFFFFLPKAKTHTHTYTWRACSLEQPQLLKQTNDAPQHQQQPRIEAEYSSIYSESNHTIFL